MDTNRKGKECLFKPMLCQEGYCIDCQIVIDADNQERDMESIAYPNASLQPLEEAVHKAEKKRRLLEWKLNFRG